MTQIIKERDFSLEIVVKFYKFLFCVVATHEYTCTMYMYISNVYNCTVSYSLSKILPIIPKFCIQNGHHFQGGGYDRKMLTPKNNAQIIGIQIVYN